jgi:hypothetical protein
MLLSQIAGRMAMTGWFQKSVIALLLLSFAFLKAEAISLTGTVVDSEGAAIGKAHIFVRPDPSGKRESVRDGDLMLKTDMQGHFNADLSPGFYDICVMADAFTPQCKKLFVASGSLTPKFQLKADPEVMKRLGDKF